MKKKIISIIATVILLTTNISAYAGGMGVCTHSSADYENGKIINVAKETGVTWIRDEVYWNDVESIKGEQKTIPQSKLDYIKNVNEQGINMLLILDYGNKNYVDGDSNNVMPTTDNEEYYNAWLDYVTFMVTNVGEYVDAYEIWNEPDIAGFNTTGVEGTGYAQLYLDSKSIIDKLDPSAEVVAGALAGGLATDTYKYAKDFFAYLDEKGTVDDLLDAFSLHSYAYEPEYSYAKELGIPSYEALFDQYSFTGELWLTEVGRSTYSGSDGVTETLQAQLVLRDAVTYNKYLNEYGRDGQIIWYDLKNDGSDLSNYQHNFGLVGNTFMPKPAYYAMKLYNKATAGKELTAYSEPQTAGNWLLGKEYGMLATYTGTTGTTYIAYAINDASSNSMSVSLSGDIAYVYDYLGNVTETITSPSGTKKLSVGESPIVVECVSYGSVISDLKYNDELNVLSVGGIYTGTDSEVTIELLRNDTVVKSVKAAVTDRNYATWFSVDEDGEYTVRVAQPELSALGKTSGWETQTVVADRVGNENSSIASGAVVEYTAATNTVKVSGAVTDYVENQIVTILAVPETADVTALDMNSIGYIKQAKTTDGNFAFEFVLPEYYDTKTAIYLGGTNISTTTKDSADVAESEYVYVASLEAGVADTLSATAQVRNFAETERKATIIIAQYSGDTDTRLEDVQLKTITVPARTYAQTAVKFDAVVKDADATKVRAFIWNDAEGLVPLAPFDEKGLSN